MRMLAMPLLPTRSEDDAAQIHALERRIFIGEEIIVEGAERRAWAMLHAVIKRIDHLIGEVGVV
jgi:hypothetical protein